MSAGPLLGWAPQRQRQPGHLLWYLLSIMKLSYPVPRCSLRHSAALDCPSQPPAAEGPRSEAGLTRLHVSCVSYTERGTCQVIPGILSLCVVQAEGQADRRSVNSCGSAGAPAWERAPPVSPVSSVISVSLSPAAPPLVWMGVVGRSAVEKRGEIH